MEGDCKLYVNGSEAKEKGGGGMEEWLCTPYRISSEK